MMPEQNQTVYSVPVLLFKVNKELQIRPSTFTSPLVIAEHDYSMIGRQMGRSLGFEIHWAFHIEIQFEILNL